MRFSQRIGVSEVRSALQGRSLDGVTRSRLWSAFALAVPEAGGYETRRTWMRELYEHLWADFLILPVDETPTEAKARELLKKIFLEGKWYEVYDLLEFTIQSPKMGNKDRLINAVNSVLEQEMAGFRLIGGEFVEVTDETEIAAIEEAFEVTGEEFSNARAHLSSALRLLSDRRDPDYRNSVKESISAVEAVVQTLTGDPKAELGKAMRLLEREAPVHGAFASALRSLYGYTSDADGIRHALIEEPNLDAPTAKFMLVVCSAFVVYLIQQVPRQDS